MGRLVRIMFVGLLALAFLLERSAITLGCEARSAAGAESVDAMHAHAEHHHHGGPSQPSPDPSSKHTCLKCCGICTVDPNLTAGKAAGAIILSVVPIVYSRDFQAHSGQMVVLDPGIPKRSA